MKKLNQTIIWAACFVLAYIPLSVWAQAVPGHSTYSNPLPELSPNAIAAQNVNVDLYRGLANVSIPLYVVNNKRASASISLNYSPPTKDLRAVYHPGWTGLSWTLSAGGLITRTVRGVRDESVTENAITVWPYGQWSKCDQEEDEFTFNFCGHSGKFFWHKGRWVIHDTQTPQISISMDYVGGNLGNALQIKGFQLLFPDGFRYTFGVYGAGIYNPNIYNEPSIEGSSAWYLTRIESPDGDCLYFNYEKPTNASMQPAFNYSRFYSVVSQESNPSNWIPIHTYMKEEPIGTGSTSGTPTSYTYPSGVASIYPVYLQSITGGTVSVYFHRSSAIEKRYHSQTGSSQSYKLSEIEIKEEDTCFKKYQLTYTNDTTQVLKLLSVKEQGVNANNSIVDKPAYFFGYYNPTAWLLEFSGIEMSPLQKITYPAGGFTTFEYELFAHDNANCEITIPNIYNIYNRHHAFRIKKTKSYGSPGDNTPEITEYIYGQGVRSRPKILTSKLHVYMGVYLRLEANIYTNYDQFRPEIQADDKTYLCKYNAMVVADVISYEKVDVIKSKGNSSGYISYYFSNYGKAHNLYPSLRNKSQNLKAGTLLRTVDWSGGSKHTITDYDYSDMEWEVDSVKHKWTRGFPFKQGSGEYTYVVKDSLWFHYNWHPTKPTKITKYAYPNETTSPNDSVRITGIKYDQFTGRIQHQETRDRGGNVYRTEYRYHGGELHPYSVSGINIPIETVTKKNGNVIAATVTHDTVIYNGNNRNVLRPAKIFTLTTATPITNYQPAIFGAGSIPTVVDSRCKLVTTYRYNSKGMPVRVQNTGEPPTFFVWHSRYEKPLLVIEGAEEAEYLATQLTIDENNTVANQIAVAQKLRKRLPNARITSYTYCLHGVTSVTDPTGNTLYMEYDVFGRPLSEKDDEGNIIKKIQYNYGIN